MAGWPRAPLRGDTVEAMSAEEIVLLDEAGHAVGTAPKITSHHAHTPYHLAFSCYLLDDLGRVPGAGRPAGVLALVPAADRPARPAGPSGRLARPGPGDPAAGAFLVNP